MKTPSQRFFDGLIDASKPWGFLLTAIISGQIGERSKNPIVAALVVIGIGLAFWFWQKRSKKDEAYIIHEPIPPEPKEGLILLLSPYNPRCNKDREEIKNKIEQIIGADLSQMQANTMQRLFDDINFLNSNLQPQLEAIKYHRENPDKTLRDIWLIGTKTNATGEGSEKTVALLEKYIQFRYGQTVKIHSDGLIVDDLAWPELCQKVEHIFQTASHKHERIVADITGGTKMMSIALCIGCIQPGRRMQYMDAKRDYQGDPLTGGSMVPILVDIDPYVYRDTSS